MTSAMQRQTLQRWDARHFVENAAGYSDTACGVSLCGGQLQIVPGAPPTDTSLGYRAVVRLGIDTIEHGLGTSVRWRQDASIKDDATTINFEASTSRMGRLLLCRIGGSFRYHRWLSDESSPVTPDTISEFAMASIDTLEVGLTASWYGGAGNGISARFDKVIFHTPPSSHAECDELFSK